ncbi:hypothetical protein ACJMK2_028319 [Sinanodonta woodiana]|uniref:Uncharacterized protein n=1 Tax=Sinanodonta woodiana TaxID=1069815 RepID=A0ABD3XAB7_SINWO
MDLDISPTSNTRNSLNPISSKCALKRLLEELEDTFADDEDDITDTVDVFSHHRSSAQNSLLVDPESLPIQKKAKKYLPNVSLRKYQQKHHVWSQNAKRMKKISEETSTSAINEKSQAKIVEKDLDMKQKLNEEKIKDRREENRKENTTCNAVTEDISCSEQIPNGEELSKLEELRTTLMG